MNSVSSVSFCISTYKRPEILRKQLTSLLAQTFPHFSIIVSDNDPEESAKSIVESFDDLRLKYFSNGENLGMMKSFNKSIERAESEYIVMVTDDDPVKENFLSDFHKLHTQFPNYSIYCGFCRNKKKHGNLEVIEKDNFLIEILDPDKTPKILWSSCVMKKESVLEVGQIPDYGSPHLADHALIAMAGSKAGGVVVNKMYSSLTSHDTNFSKSNFDYYIKGCKGFYETLTHFCKDDKHSSKEKEVIIKHLGVWVIASIFTLKRHYTVKNYDPVKLKEIDAYASTILNLGFMWKFRKKVYLKEFVFQIKKRLGLLKYFL